MLTYTLRDNSSGETYLLDGEILLGRGESCDLVIRNATLSRKHAALRCDDLGCAIWDCSSTNGSYVNGDRIPSERWVPLHSGDEIMLGTEVRFRVLVDEPERPSPVFDAPDPDDSAALTEPAPQPAPPPAPQPVPTPTPQPVPTPTAPVRQADPQPEVNPILRLLEQGAASGKSSPAVLIGCIAATVVLTVLFPPLCVPGLIATLILAFRGSGRRNNARGYLSRRDDPAVARLLSGSWRSSPDYPLSGVYVGDHALFLEKTCQLIPLDGLVWIYLHQATYLFIPIAKAYQFSYLPRKVLSVSMKDSELKDLAQRFLLPRCPGLMLGYTPENCKRYAELTKQA